MSDDRMKPTRHYPVISIEAAIAKGFDAQIVEALDSVATSKPMKLRVWGREGVGVDGARTYLYLVTPRGGGDIASTLVRALNALSRGEHVRVEGSLPPNGDEVLMFEVDGRVARSTRRA